MSKPDDGSLITVRRTGRLNGADINTEEYPGFATDLQAQYMALMTQAEGITSSRKTSSRIASCTFRS